MITKELRNHQNILIRFFGREMFWFIWSFVVPFVVIEIGVLIFLVATLFTKFTIGASGVWEYLSGPVVIALVAWALITPLRWVTGVLQYVYNFIYNKNYIKYPNLEEITKEKA